MGQPLPITALKPAENCYCETCETLREVARQEALQRTVNSWPVKTVGPGETLAFGKAAA